MSQIIKGDPAIEADKKFLAGQEVVQGNTTWKYLYVPANTLRGDVLVLSFDGDEETNPKGLAAATSSVYQHVVVAGEAQGATAGFQWCAIKGDCSALVDGTTDVAKDDFLEILNATNNLVKDATTRSVNSVAIAREAVTANADTLALIHLIGERVIVAAT